MSFSVFKKKDAEKLKIENFNPFDAKSGTKVDIEVNDNKNNENKKANGAPRKAKAPQAENSKGGK